MFSGIFLHLFFDIIGDWTRLMMISGVPIAIIGDYFNSLTKDEDENGGCSWFIMLLVIILWMFEIEHFTPKIIAGLVICCILGIVAFLLTLKRWKRFKTLEKEQKEKEDQE
jgi:hypothetical protein